MRIGTSENGKNLEEGVPLEVIIIVPNLLTSLQVILSILHTEKRIYVKKFFVSLLSDLFRYTPLSHFLKSFVIGALVLSHARLFTRLRSR